MLISSKQARRFILHHQGLFPPRQLSGKDGVMEYVRRVGCIQYDPLNMVGINPDLVLQSRIGGYKPSLLYELLYEDRLLVDGWDKQATFQSLEEAGKISSVEVGDKDITLYIRSELLPQMAECSQEGMKGVSFIAPLDNLIWDRKLIAQLFDFEYTWEVYKPSTMRQYGYYVLPVLYGDRFIARFEPRLNKKANVLEVLNWWWEPDVTADKDMVQAIKRAAGDFMSYLGASRIGEMVDSPLS